MVYSESKYHETPPEPFHAERQPRRPEVPPELRYPMQVIDPTNSDEVESLFMLDKAVQATTPHIYPVDTIEEFRAMLEKNDALTLALRDTETEQFMGYVTAVVNKHRHYILEISSLAVSPDFQRRGCGYQLMTHIENFAQEIECTELQLWVSGNNEQALSFYVTYGFRLPSHTKIPFGDEAGGRILLYKTVGMQPINWVYDLQQAI